MRFNKYCNTYEGASEYYINRATQLLYTGIILKEIRLEPYGVRALFNYHQLEYQSFYLLKQYHGNNLLIKCLNEYGNNIIVSSDCSEMSSYLDKNGINYKMVYPYSSQAYHKISGYYGDKKSKRSNIYYMNHIDEGIALAIRYFKYGQDVIDSYCLHPLIQMDLDLTINQQMDFGNITKYVYEYRNIANQYLRGRKINNKFDIKLSPIEVVNQMLTLDKVQNYKDFIVYHKETHPKSAELEEYFNNWLDRLLVDKKTYEEAVSYITISPKILDLR